MEAKLHRLAMFWSYLNFTFLSDVELTSKENQNLKSSITRHKTYKKSLKSLKNALLVGAKFRI